VNVLRDQAGEPLTAERLLVRALQEAEAYRFALRCAIERLRAERLEHASTRRRYDALILEFRQHREAVRRARR
jgi:hypothetical protein